MAIVIAFFTALLGIPASLGVSLEEPKCRTSEFTTLMYHHVRPYVDLDSTAKNISVSPEEFRTQMKFLHDNKYVSITSRDIHEGTVPCKSVMITFDDGYHDVFTQAYPIMKQYNFVGIIGLILAKIDESDYLS
jgi:peptidoglycan/xylan/chitin deacetylase (PgdA/CDA1 family)